MPPDLDCLLARGSTLLSSSVSCLAWLPIPRELPGLSPGPWRVGQTGSQSVSRGLGGGLFAQDVELYQNFRAMTEEGRLPGWWANPAVAPDGAAGAQGFNQACAAGALGQCLLPSRTIYDAITGMRHLYDLLVGPLSVLAAFANPLYDARLDGYGIQCQCLQLSRHLL